MSVIFQSLHAEAFKDHRSGAALRLVSIASEMPAWQLPLVDRIQHLVPTSGCGDDGVGIGCPDERFGALIVLGEVAVDGRLGGRPGNGTRRV